MKKVIYFLLILIPIFLLSCTTDPEPPAPVEPNPVTPVTPVTPITPVTPPDNPPGTPSLSLSVIQAISDQNDGAFIVNITISNNGTAIANNINWYFNIYGNLQLPINFNTVSRIVPPSSLGIGEETSFIIIGYAITYIPFYYLFQIDCDSIVTQEIYNNFRII